MTTPTIEKVNLADKFAMFNDHWNPRIAGELNGQQVKLVKFQGPFTWHKHDHEDELFLVIEGCFTMQLEDKDLQIEAGEFVIIPRGVMHRPVADKEVKVLLFEPASTLNTGDAPVSALTRSELNKI
jgi:mannose-6-phosphate isomerase-like protein (cupin superfamily)